MPVSLEIKKYCFFPYKIGGVINSHASRGMVWTKRIRHIVWRGEHSLAHGWSHEFVDISQGFYKCIEFGTNVYNESL